MIELGGGWFRVECVAGGELQREVDDVPCAICCMRASEMLGEDKCVACERDELQEAVEARDRTIRKWQQSYDAQYERLVDVIAERDKAITDRDSAQAAYRVVCDKCVKFKTQLDDAMKLLRELYSGWNLGRIELGTFHAAKALVEKYGGGK